MIDFKNLKLLRYGACFDVVSGRASRRQTENEWSLWGSSRDNATAKPRYFEFIFLSTSHSACRMYADALAHVP